MARKSKQPKDKRMNPTFFVFCEGKTEAAYVDLLRRNFRVPVEIIIKVSDSNISQPYIERSKREKFTTPKDKTFLMFDLDVAGMLEHLKKIKDAQLLLSNPCIEYWFLLHYRDVSKELSSNECLSMLKKQDKGYLKGGFTTEMTKVLLDKIDEASSRAKTKTPSHKISESLGRFWASDFRKLKRELSELSDR